MARFGVYRLAGATEVVDVQSDFLDWIETRLVVPLVPRSVAPPAARYLNPIFDIEGSTFVMVTQSMSAVPVAALGPRVATLADYQDEITRALDFVFQGF